MSNPHKVRKAKEYEETFARGKKSPKVKVKRREDSNLRGMKVDYKLTHGRRRMSGNVAFDIPAKNEHLLTKKKKKAKSK